MRKVRLGGGTLRERAAALRILLVAVACLTPGCFGPAPDRPAVVVQDLTINVTGVTADQSFAIILPVLINVSTPARVFEVFEQLTVTRGSANVSVTENDTHVLHLSIAARGPLTLSVHLVTDEELAEPYLDARWTEGVNEHGTVDTTSPAGLMARGTLAEGNAQTLNVTIDYVGSGRFCFRHSHYQGDVLASTVMTPEAQTLWGSDSATCT